MKLKSFAFAALALVAGASAQAQTEIQWWHSMTAFNNEWVNTLAKQFNESQKTYKVTPIYKGSSLLGGASTRIIAVPAASSVRKLA